MTKAKQSKILELLIDKLENVVVDTQDLDIDECINLKLNSEDALDIVANTLKQYKNITVSTISKATDTEVDLYIKIND